MKPASALAMKIHAPTTSCTSPIRPMGTLAVNFSRFAGVSSMPVKAEKSPVPVTSGQMELTRIWCGPYSAASPFVAFGEGMC